jgi:hypothetical protein
MARHLHFAPKSGKAPTRCHPRSSKNRNGVGMLYFTLPTMRMVGDQRVQKKLICRVPLLAGSRYCLTSHSAGTGGHSKGIKWPEREADHSPLLCAVIKNTSGCTSIHCIFKIQCLTTHNDIPTLPLWLISYHTTPTATVVACSDVLLVYFTALSTSMKTRSQKRRSNSTLPNAKKLSPTAKMNFLSVASRYVHVYRDERVNMTGWE